MADQKKVSQEITCSHFVKRAGEYDSSSSWVNDAALIDKIKGLADAKSSDYVLDIAVGTGKIAQAFYGNVRYVVGLDICQEMFCQARGHTDSILLSKAERLPFRDNIFDICVCRQGLQFMELDSVLSEIYRVLKPCAKVVLCHLSAYSSQDKDETFLIQKIRNPARVNFFLPEDIPDLLWKKSFSEVESFEYITRESVGQWIDKAAIDTDARNKIIEAYQKASESFRRIHGIAFVNGDFYDSMKMVIVIANKR